MKLEDHPTVQKVRLKAAPSVPPKMESLDAGWLKQLVLDTGADDVGFVEIGRPALDDQREDILKAFPHTKALISFVVRMNREAIRTPARSVSNTEFHHSGDEVNDIARSVVRTLEDRGIRAMNPAMGFPMEMDQFPGKVWVVSHKPVAVAAGLGMMGIHRNVIHLSSATLSYWGPFYWMPKFRSPGSRSITTLAWSANCASLHVRWERSPTKGIL